MCHQIRLCDGSDWKIQAEILSRQYHLVTQCTGFGGRTELKLQFFFFETMRSWESYCTPSVKVVFSLILSLIPFCLVVIFPHLLLLCSHLPDSYLLTLLFLHLYFRFVSFKQLNWMFWFGPHLKVSILGLRFSP